MTTVLQSDGVSHLDTDSISQQRHAEEAARAVENSTAWKIRRLLDNAAMPSYDHTPQLLADELESCRDKLQTLRKRGDDGVAQVRNLVQAGSSVEDFQSLAGALDLHRSEQLSLLRDVAEWYTAAVDLTQQHVAALRPISEKLDIDAEKWVGQVKEDMARIGFFVQSMPGYSEANPDAAERQYDYIARHNIKTECAIRDMQMARDNCSAAVEVMHRIPERLKATRELLQKITMKAVTSSV